MYATLLRLDTALQADEEAAYLCVFGRVESDSRVLLPHRMITPKEWAQDGALRRKSSSFCRLLVRDLIDESEKQLACIVLRSPCSLSLTTQARPRRT
jgi:hypothetical protein